MPPLKRPIPILTQELVFPPVRETNEEGLLAVGGDLSADRLILAYKSGIFPWFNDDSVILWWSPNPRMVLFPSNIKISKSMRKVIQSGRFSLSRNRNFEEVLNRCSKIKRKGQQGTWITPDMRKAYMELHEQGYARSYEVWEKGTLVGGLYGIDLGHVFCGESMFFTTSNASKYAFIKLAQDLNEKGYRLIDCQVYNRHLASLGAEEIPREEFLGYLRED